MIFIPDFIKQQKIVLFGLIRLTLWLPDNRCKTLASFCYYAIIRKKKFPAAYSGPSILSTYALTEKKTGYAFLILLYFSVFTWPIS